MRQRDDDKTTYESGVALAKQILKKKLSPRSLKDYRQAYLKLRKMGLTPQEYCDQKKIKRYYPIKAAYQYGQAVLVVGLDQSAKEHLDRGDHKMASKLRAEAEKAMWALQDQKPDYERQRYRKNMGPAHPVPQTKTRKKFGKRQYAGKLNKAFNGDWQTPVFHQMASQHKFATAILNLAGCRMVELKKPMEIGLTLDGKLRVKIQGAKVTEYSGQKERTLIFDPKDQKASRVISILKEQNRHTLVWEMKCSIDTLRKAHNKAVRLGLGEKWVGKAGLYSYRHAFSADLKKAGYSREEIALAMGHVSDRSQVYYGMAAQSGGGGRGLENVEATREVKTRESVAERMATREQTAADLDLLDGIGQEQKEREDQDYGLDLDF